MDTKLTSNLMNILGVNVINPKKKVHHFVPDTEISVWLSEFLALGYFVTFCTSIYLYSRLVKKQMTHTLLSRLLMLVIFMSMFRSIFWAILPFNILSSPIAFYFLWSIGGDIFITAFLACGGYFFSLFNSLKSQRMRANFSTMYQVFIVNALFYSIQTILFFILTINLSLFTATQPLFFALVALFSSLFFVILGVKISIQIKKLQASSASFLADFKTARMRAVSAATFFLTFGFLLRAIVDLFWEQDLSSLATDSWYEFIVPFYFVIEIIPIFAVLNMIHVKEPTAADVKKLLAARSRMLSHAPVKFQGHYQPSSTTPNSLMALPTHPENLSHIDPSYASSGGYSSYSEQISGSSHYDSYDERDSDSSPFPNLNPLPNMLRIQVGSMAESGNGTFSGRDGESASNGTVDYSGHGQQHFPIPEETAHRQSITHKWASFFFPPLGQSDMGAISGYAPNAQIERNPSQYADADASPSSETPLLHV